MKIYIYLLILSTTIFISCKIIEKNGESLQGKHLADGEYFGNYKGGPNSAEVKVLIENHRISHIELIKHDAWKGVKAEDSVIQRIMKHQSTDVDAVTGATNSSHVIMNAVDIAVKKAYQ